MKKAITEMEIIRLLKSGATEILLNDDQILTPLAIDRIKLSGLKVVRSGQKSSTGKGSAASKVAVGSDHTGVKVKKVIVDYLKKLSCDVIDVGTFTEDPVDYPDFAAGVATRVINGEAAFGIVIDATGIPSAITANKFPGIRAATCYNEFSAKSAREHNNANILALGAKTLGEETIKSILDVWLKSDFLEDRHQRRLDKITAIEQKYSKK